MIEFRGNTVLTFDKKAKGSIVLEHLDDLENSIRRWLEKNLEYIDFVIPIEDSLVTDPVQAMFCGPIARMHEALAALQNCHLNERITVLRTEYPVRDLSIVDILNQGCSKGHALERWAALRGLSRDQVMAIGDNYNDIEMLAFAGYPVIMGNASEDLRSRGWKVTLTNDQNGVAAALEPVLARVGVRDVALVFWLWLGCLPCRNFCESEWFCRMNLGKSLGMVVLLGVGAMQASATDVATLRNGFTIRHESRAPLGETTRLFLTADGSSFVDVPTAEIVQIEPDLNAPATPEKSSETLADRACGNESCPACNGSAHAGKRRDRRILRKP